MELLFILLPGGLLFGLGAAWVVFRASSGRPVWVRSVRVLAVVLACMAAPVIFFAVLGAIAKYTQPSLSESGAPVLRASTYTASPLNH